MVFTFLFYKFRAQYDVIWGNEDCAQSIQNRLSIKQPEHLIRTVIAEICSCVGVDVVHDDLNLFLIQIIKRSPLRKNTPNELVIIFSGPFLVRRGRIAVKYSCSLILFAIQF